ncbi:MAG TPA: 2Fe-2S iron-sulfur cluster-binding protein [Pyrinomonadaceae bacterium]|jgi:2Fe-2S ferredoxin
MEAELRFERENTGGVAVVGAYLIDASRRLGVEIFDECGRLGLCDSCAVTIKSGAEFLTPPTKAEIEQLSEDRRKNGERLSCQAKIAAEGEIVILTREKADEEPEDINETYRKEFAELPLDKKVANLMQLEAMTLSETFSFILNSPNKIVGALIGVMAQFGLKIEDEEKKAKRPEEHKADDNVTNNGAANDEDAPKEKKSQKKSAAQNEAEK